MLNLIPDILVSLCAFLFPVFASYKALKTSDPEQLAPWLMYWVVLGLLMVAESWVAWIVVWIPFYSCLRLVAVLLMVLPQTQLARTIYLGYVHPWLEDHEEDIEQAMANMSERARRTGITWLRQVAEQIGDVLTQHQAQAPEPTPADPTQGYVQSLLARFNVPVAYWAGGMPRTSTSTSSPATPPRRPPGAPSNTPDWLHMALTSFIATSSTSAKAAEAKDLPSAAAASRFDMTSLMPSHIRSAEARQQFVAAQRERISAWDASLARWQQQNQTEVHKDARVPSIGLDGGSGETSHEESSSLLSDPFAVAEATRPSTGQSNQSSGGLSKSRSEADFEKVDEADVSGAEEDMVVRRRGGAGEPAPSPGLKGYLPAWMTGASGTEKGQSTSVEQQ